MILKLINDMLLVLTLSGILIWKFNQYKSTSDEWKKKHHDDIQYIKAKLETDEQLVAKDIELLNKRVEKLEEEIKDEISNNRKQ